MASVICIDPGHGGYDPGACANGLQEKDLNLFVALQLKELLQAAGIKVIMTRDKDIALSNPKSANREYEDLKARCDVCNDARADWFHSLHFNSFNGNASGAESYAIPGGRAINVAPKLTDACGKIFGVHGEKVKDGGVNGTNFLVLKKTNPPAILTEIAFITSVNDAEKIKSRLGEIAVELASVWIPVLGGKLPTKTPIVPTLPSNYVTHAELATILEQFKKSLGV